jgi:hypothetical protein
MPRPFVEPIVMQGRNTLSSVGRTVDFDAYLNALSFFLASLLASSFAGSFALQDISTIGAD